MSQTIVNLGYVLKNRGEYKAEPETRYYKDNVVQYQGSAFICDPVDYDKETNPLAYVTVAPYDTNPNQPNEGWKVFASDAAYVNSIMTWEENPEWIEVHLDAEQKVLYGVKTNGEFFFGSGIPSQVKGYLNQKIAELSLDEYESIVAFLDDYLGSDTTLKMLIDGKVDIEEGKSLMSSEEHTKLEALPTNAELIDNLGNKVDVVEGKQLSTEDYTTEEKTKLGALPTNADLTEALNGKVDKETGKSLMTEAEHTKLGNLPNNASLTDSLATKVDKEEGKGLSTNDYTNADKELVAVHEIVDNPEYIKVETDSEGKIISYRDANGVKHENVGIGTNKLVLSKEGMDEFQQALKDAGFNPGSTGDWSDYISGDGEKPLHIATPRCAKLNLLTDFDLTQLSKSHYDETSQAGVNYNIPIYVEFWDMQGNYFKKKAFISGQGRSTMGRPKKNIAIDFFDSEWDSDAFSIKFGDWVPQDSFHLKAYAEEGFNASGAWAYKINDMILKSRGIEEDYVWKKALLDMTQNTSTVPYGETALDNEKYADTGAKCFPDGFPVIVYQQGEFWGVFAWQIKKHRDNYHMNKKKVEHIHLDGILDSYTWDTNGTVNWWSFEVRNPKNLVYADEHEGTYKYDADIYQGEIAGNSDGSMNYDVWAAGSYAKNKIVQHNGHYYINTIANNTTEPVYDKKNNGDDAPDFKNKTGCNWINCTNTIKVKNNVRKITMIMPAVDALEAAYIANPTEANLNAMKAEFERHFDVDNLIDYIIVTDVIRDEDAFASNWQWTTYDGGTKWWVNLYDCNIAFGYIQGLPPYRAPLTDSHCNGSNNFMLAIIFKYYKSELEARWAWLRNNSVITTENLFEVINSWIKTVGTDNYILEWNKWGSLCSPDNIFRLHKWIDENVNGLDNVYNYTNNQ